MTLFGERTSMPLLFGTGTVPVGVGADEIALDMVAATVDLLIEMQTSARSHRWRGP